MIIDNKSFWIYFLGTNFPNAYDEESDICLSDFIFDEYEYDDVFINQFTQYSEDIFDISDGYVDNPNTIKIPLKNHSFRIEFHAGDTVYFLDGNEIGCTGPHFILRKISVQTFNSLIDGIEDVRIPLLILPMLALNDNEQDVLYIRKIIHNGLNCIGIKKEHINIVADMIISGLL